MEIEVTVMPKSAEWLQKTHDGSFFGNRGTTLEKVDAALAHCERMPSEATMIVLARSFSEYRLRHPQWLMSPRNRSGAMTQLSAAISEKLESLRCKAPYVWCPGVDDEMRKCATNLIENLHLHPVLLTTNDDLSKFSASAHLYLLAHGHSSMPLFTTKAGKWTADQLADLLLATGIDQTIRNITMLVCHAGESVNTIENANAMMDLSVQFASASEERKAELNKKYEEIKQSAREPGLYERTGDSLEDIESQSKLLLPMAAQLSAALKHRGFSHFQLISFKAPVMQNFGEIEVQCSLHKYIKLPAGIKLDLRSKRNSNAKLYKKSPSYVGNAPASQYPEYTAIWR